MIVVQEYTTSYRVVLLTAFGIFAMFASRVVHFSGAGPLGVLAIAFVAALRWRKEIIPASEVQFSLHCMCTQHVLLIIIRIIILLFCYYSILLKLFTFVCCLMMLCLVQSSMRN